MKLNKTIVYTYDAGGNIVSKKEYGYTTGSLSSAKIVKTINYTYGNTNWKDQLTSYSGKEITYDEIGNPLTYDGNTYTWQNGRELASIANGNTTIEYKYNDSGIRTSKTVNGVETKYYLDGSKVIYEKTGEKTIYYTYNESSDIIGFNYEGNKYYYVKNIQNDIIGILNSNLEQIVSYEYDSWGQVISIEDNNGNDITDETNIGLINPYRYRSYRYDSDTKLYYLNSRYYNPEWGRFINADGLLSTGQGLLSHNMYAYCENNPINNIDPTGKFIMKLLYYTAKFIINTFIDIAPKAEFETEIMDEDIGIDIGIIKTSTKATVKKELGDRNNNKIGYINKNKDKVSAGITLGNISFEKSYTGSSITIQGKESMIQYEREYALINKFSYIDYSSIDNITNSTYYTFEINQWYTLAAATAGAAIYCTKCAATSVIIEYVPRIMQNTY